VIAPSGINTSSVFPYLNSGSEDPHEDEYGNSRVNFTSFINIPDATFRAYCLSNFDTNKDGKISLSEAAAAKTVNVAGTAVASLEGIQYFTNITLLECSSCNLEGTLDVSMLMKMEYCQCSNNKLTKLILPENSALIRLQCDRNRISSIDVQRCFKLGAAWVGAQTSDGTTGIYIKVYLEDAFTSVLKDNIFPLLNDADGYNARVAIPVIFRDDNFEAYCLSNFDTNKDGVVSREEAKAVTEISCPGSKIRNLDGIEWFTNLVNLHVQKNRISSLYLNDFKKLKFVEAGDMMSLTYVSVSGCSSLYYLSIYSCSISSVNLKGCSALSELYCYDNRLQSIDLNGINALTEAYVGAQSADGSKLHSVILYNTTLAESVFPKFDVAGYTNMLVVFDGRNIPFTKTNKGVQDWLIAAGYDKDGDGKISYYEASLADSLSGVGTSDMAALSGNGFKYLCNLRYLWNNQINDGTDWKYFKQFSMDIACGRRTIEMDLSNNLLLEYLNLSPATYVYYNGKKDFYKITGGVTKLAVPYSLKSLSVSGCSLKALDLANCTKLEFLNCGYNSISQLYVWNSYRLQRAVVGHQRYTATSGDYEELPIMLEVYIPKGWTDERIQSVFAIDPTDLKQNIQIHPSY
jgi:Leucine-rich repeat (LRR) protein